MVRAFAPGTAVLLTVCNDLSSSIVVVDGSSSLHGRAAEFYAHTAGGPNVRAAWRRAFGSSAPPTSWSPRMDLVGLATGRTDPSGSYVGSDGSASRTGGKLGAVLLLGLVARPHGGGSPFFLMFGKDMGTKGRSPQGKLHECGSDLPEGGGTSAAPSAKAEHEMCLRAAAAASTLIRRSHTPQMHVPAVLRAHESEGLRLLEFRGGLQSLFPRAAVVATPQALDVAAIIELCHTALRCDVEMVTGREMNHYSYENGILAAHQLVCPPLYPQVRKYHPRRFASWTPTEPWLWAIEQRHTLPSLATSMVWMAEWRRLRVNRKVLQLGTGCAYEI